MNFYYNENNLMHDATNVIENIKEMKKLYETLKNSGNTLMVKDSFCFPYAFIDIRRVGSALGFIKNIQRFKESDNWLEVEDIDPQKESCHFIELISACYENRNNLIVSSTNETDIIDKNYNIKNNEIIIENIIGKKQLNEYVLLNPVPNSIIEVFERASMNFNKIKFSDKAYETAVAKNDIYKSFGFDRILNVFKVIQELLYSFYKGKLNGYNQESIQEEFKRLTGIDFSCDSEATLKKYATERLVAFNGRKIKMSFHIKIKGQGRIYFSYEEDDDCILIGHCGGHLRTVKYN